MQDGGISILKQFSRLKDPRVDRTKRHNLTEVIAIEICGANGLTDVELFGKSKQEWLKTFLELPSGRGEGQVRAASCERVVICEPPRFGAEEGRWSFQRYNGDT